MSSYIKDLDLDEFRDDEDWERYYEDLEEQAEARKRKRQTKLRTYDGYELDNDDNGGGK